MASVVFACATNDDPTKEESYLRVMMEQRVQGNPPHWSIRCVSELRARDFAGTPRWSWWIWRARLTTTAPRPPMTGTEAR